MLHLLIISLGYFYIYNMNLIQISEDINIWGILDDGNGIYDKFGVDY